MSLATFYKYARLLGATSGIKTKDKTPKPGLKADKPLQILHTDLTELRIKDNLKVYVSLVIDYFSRSVLAWSVATDKKPVHTMLNLQRVYLQYLQNKDDTQLVCNGGSENKGETDIFLDATNIQKLVAQCDISFSNSMVEAINKKLKYEYWLTPQRYSIDTFTKLTEQSIADYNNRPHGELNGITPNEALTNNPCPSYTLEIKNAARNRIIANQNSNCKQCER